MREGEQRRGRWRRRDSVAKQLFSALNGNFRAQSKNIRQICTSNQRQLNNCEHRNHNWSTDSYRARETARKRQNKHKEEINTYTHTHTHHTQPQQQQQQSSSRLQTAGVRVRARQHCNARDNCQVLLLLLFLLLLLHFLLGNSIEKCAGDGVGKCHLRRTHDDTHILTRMNCDSCRDLTTCVCVCVSAFMLFFYCMQQNS